MIQAQINIKRVVVGISGGVDSAVSALLLKQKGFDVVSVFMKNWDEVDETGHCTSNNDFEDACRVCNKLNLHLHTVNFVKEYWNYVFSNFITDYETGYTPNPDILCNQYVKFDCFYRYARQKLQADAIATGHYARTSFGSYLEKYSNTENVKLLTSVDSHKDQTFFLSQIPQEALRRTMFPVGGMTKNAVRQIATEYQLKNVSNKPDSTGICFIGHRKFHEFISEYIHNKPGNFIDIDTGKIIGTHNGIHYWTLGQNARISGQLKPYFIVRKCPDQQTIYVAAETNHPALFSQLVFTTRPHWIDKEPELLKNNGMFECEFRFQHTKPLTNCQVIKSGNNELIIILKHALRALTVGQYAVLYLNNECLGSARICATGPSLYFLNKF